MDSFTQRMLELAEERSKTLGISSTNKFPLTEYNQEASVNTMKNQNSPKKSPSPTKKYSVVRKESNMSKNSSQRMSSPNDTKENVDVALEINITTGPNVQVQVEVEERDVDEHGNVLKSAENASDEHLPMIRDSSRNRLQRLGALYSETENLSSPIHRNEARFDDEAQTDDNYRGKSTTRLGKLAALASERNNWEDESSTSDGKSTKPVSSPTKSAPTIVGASPRKFVNTGAIPKQPTKSNLSPTKKMGEVTTTSDGTTKRPSKQLKWDKNVMDHLEQQGFQRRESTTSKLVYDYKEPKDSVKSAPEHVKPVQSTVESAKKTYVSTAQISQVSEVKSPRSTANNTTGKHSAVVTKGLVSDRAARFESSQPNATQKSHKDPAEMSLKERLALFEKNKGAALIPKAALGMSVSAKQIMGEGQTPKSNTPEKPKINSFNKPVFAESTASGSGIRNAVAALMSNATTLSQSQISNDIRKQREKEMNVVLGRFNRPIESSSSSEPDSTSRSFVPPAPPMPTNLLSKDRSAEVKSNAKRKSNEKLPQHQSNERRLSDEDSKRAKVNPTHNGRLYPVLSDIESQVTESDRDDCTTATMSDEQNYHHNRSYSEEDSYMDSAEEDDICNMSLGREIMQAVKRNDPLRPQTRNSLNNSNNRDSSTASEYSGNGQGDDIDDYINEALEDDDDSYQENVTPRKGSISSNSFSYARSPAKSLRHQTIDEDDCEDGARQMNFKCPVKSELTVNPSDDNNVVTLTHTVSFYRRQQSQSVNNTPVRRLAYSDEEDDSVSQSSSDTSNDNSLFDAKLKQLLENIHRQERVIYETSKALNVCAQSIEFSGSTVSVESERHLLLATKRRKALLDEVNRLKVDRCVRPPGLPTDRGTLSVKEIIIPLKEDYISKLNMDVCNGHHLVCLLTYNDQVLATNAVTTRKGLKAVKFPDELRLNNVYADFTLFLEIYGMTAQREALAQDMKKTPKTPKGKKQQQRRQPLPSPGGPSVVRTSAFTHYGSVTFSIKEVNRNSWSLNQESFVSPLLGKIFMKVHCELSVSLYHKGFLTMFEDVSGFGAWHRRWCCLHGSILSYWRYPDDEKTKPPMGSIDLQNCHSQMIEPVRRDVCARLHTVLIELKRPCQKDDKNSLVLEKHSNYTLVRHLLSADTKEDRDRWIAHFNKSLIIIRSWNAAASKKA
ncbi:anillin [Bradysia coprophila]|uniref:anillin n=1 Tax=Bradysia coprophila TaxID=38358 RepID=UPI00187D9552|nr:anillin [Bradysia coprophila]